MEKYFFLDLPRSSFKLTYVRPFVRPSVRLLPAFLGIGSLVFFWFLAQRCKMAMPKKWRSPIFRKKFFPAENAGNMPEKPVFWHFLEILSLVFSNFLQRYVLAMPMTWPSPIFEKNFFPAENAGNRRFCRFCSDFFLRFRCFFTFIANNNAHH